MGQLGDNPGRGNIASILVTAGPTHEYLDDVRYLANGSSGRMGFAFTEAAVGEGHRVVLVAGPTGLVPPSAADYRPVTSALEMRDTVAEALRESVPPIDVVVMVAAVADYRPADRVVGKPAKSSSGLTLQLVPNPDILLGLGDRKSAGELGAVLVGFALESGDYDDIVAKGTRKLDRKGLDLIVVNHISAMGAEDNEVTLVFKANQANGNPTQRLGRRNKKEVAQAILAAAVQILDDTRAGQPKRGRIS